MRCAYCSEEILDTAVVCKHCGRDLLFLLPVLQRLVDLERSLGELASAVSAQRELLAFHSSKLSSPVFARDRIRVLIPAVIGALYVVDTWWWTSFYWEFPNGMFLVRRVVLLMMFLPFGVWAGVWSRGKRLRDYVTLGLASGLIMYFGIAAVLRRVQVVSGPITWSDLERMFIYTIGAGLSFVTGALLGDQIEMYRHPERRTSSAADRLARKIVRHDKTNPTETDTVRIRNLATFISSIAPLLTFIGTLVSAYLS